MKVFSFIIKFRSNLKTKLFAIKQFAKNPKAQQKTKSISHKIIFFIILKVQ